MCGRVAILAVAVASLQAPLASASNHPLDWSPALYNETNPVFNDEFPMCVDWHEGVRSIGYRYNMINPMFDSFANIFSRVYTEFDTFEQNVEDAIPAFVKLVLNDMDTTTVNVTYDSKAYNGPKTTWLEAFTLFDTDGNKAVMTNADLVGTDLVKIYKETICGSAGGWDLKCNEDVPTLVSTTNAPFVSDPVQSFMKLLDPDLNLPDCMEYISSMSGEKFPQDDEEIALIKEELNNDYKESALIVTVLFQLAELFKHADTTSATNKAQPECYAIGDRVKLSRGHESNGKDGHLSASQCTTVMRFEVPCSTDAVTNVKSFSWLDRGQFKTYEDMVRDMDAVAAKKLDGYEDNFMKTQRYHYNDLVPCLDEHHQIVHIIKPLIGALHSFWGKKTDLVDIAEEFDNAIKGQFMRADEVIGADIFDGDEKYEAVWALFEPLVTIFKAMGGENVSMKLILTRLTLHQRRLYARWEDALPAELHKAIETFANSLFSTLERIVNGKGLDEGRQFLPNQAASYSECDISMQVVPKLNDDLNEVIDTYAKLVNTTNPTLSGLIANYDEVCGFMALDCVADIGFELVGGLLIEGLDLAMSAVAGGTSALVTSLSQLLGADNAARDNGLLQDLLKLADDAVDDWTNATEVEDVFADYELQNEVVTTATGLVQMMSDMLPLPFADKLLKPMFDWFVELTVLPDACLLDSFLSFPGCCRGERHEPDYDFLSEPDLVYGRPNDSVNVDWNKGGIDSVVATRSGERVLVGSEMYPYEGPCGKLRNALLLPEASRDSTMMSIPVACKPEPLKRPEAFEVKDVNMECILTCESDPACIAYEIKYVQRHQQKHKLDWAEGQSAICEHFKEAVFASVTKISRESGWCKRSVCGSSHFGWHPAPPPSRPYMLEGSGSVANFTHESDYRCFWGGEYPPYNKGCEPKKVSPCVSETYYQRVEADGTKKACVKCTYLSGKSEESCRTAPTPTPAPTPSQKTRWGDYINQL
jgi:hypothetical protein